MRGSHAVMGLFALACSSSVQTVGGCTKDTDCKGDRICSAGRCIASVDDGGSSGASSSGGSHSSGSTISASDLPNGGRTASGAGGRRGATDGGSSTSAGGALVLGVGGTAGSGTGGSHAGTGGTQAVCGGQRIGSDPSPVDMYVMFDQSSSMADPIPGSSPMMTWWQAAQQGVTNFVNDPRATGMSSAPARTVGIQFFPLNGVAPQSCMADYETPEVELGLLPGNAAAVSAAIEKHQPTAFTPTAPALQGAIAHMKAWAPKHPGHAPVVVLVTDGFPTECDPQDITDIATIVQNAFSTEPKVRTYVVGFDLGPGGSNLDALAEAGGSGKAFLIDRGDIGAQFVDAMASISNTPLPCKFDIPTPPMGMTLDINRVALGYTPSATGVEAQVPKLRGLSDCELNMGNGWYFDSSSNPTQIITCPGTCAKLASGSVMILTGCAPITGLTQ